MRPSVRRRLAGALEVLGPFQDAAAAALEQGSVDLLLVHAPTLHPAWLSELQQAAPALKTVRTAAVYRFASESVCERLALAGVPIPNNHQQRVTGEEYLAYLRGDPTHEENSSATGSARIYRTRSRAVGDIVGSKARPVGRPDAPYSSAANPGYATFKFAVIDNGGTANGGLNVVYRRPDGNIGWIDPERTKSLDGNGVNGTSV